MAYGKIGNLAGRAGSQVVAGSAGGQVVREICVVVSALRRSVSLYGSINWNLADKSTALVGADALIGPQENSSCFLGIPANS